MKQFDAESAMTFDAKFAENHLLVLGELKSMAVLRSMDGSVAVLPLIGSKDECYRVMAIAAVAFDAMAVTMLAEAWMATARPDELKIVGNRLEVHGRLPRQREDRREVVIVAMVHRTDDGELAQLVQMRPIERGGDGKVTGLGETDSASDSVRMRLADVLLPMQPTAHMRKLALDVLKTLGMEAKMIHPAGHA